MPINKSAKTAKGINTAEKNPNYFLSFLHKQSCDEISHYRNREWANVVLFTTANIAFIAFYLAGQTKNISAWALVFLLFSVTFGNVHFTCYSHKMIAVNRVIRDKIEFKLINKKIKFFEEHWNRGYVDHLLIFFIFNGAIFTYGLIKILPLNWLNFSWLAAGYMMIVDSFKFHSMSSGNALAKKLSRDFQLNPKFDDSND